MAKTKQIPIPILGSKAIIFKNKYDVWQFRMYVKNARRYVEKSLRTKEQALAEQQATKKYAVHPFNKSIILNWHSTNGGFI